MLRAFVRFRRVVRRPLINTAPLNFQDLSIGNLLKIHTAIPVKRARQLADYIVAEGGGVVFGARYW